MKKKLFSLLLFISLLVLPISFVRAEDNYFNVGENVTLSEEEYNHNVFSAGDNVSNNAKVNGLLFSAGNNVNLNGNVDYGFLAGQTININGLVNNDIFAAGGSIIINKDSDIKRDIYIAANNIDIKANLAHNAFVAGSIVN